MFDGSYHGHIGETLVDYAHESPKSYALGMPGDHARKTTVVPFNNLEAAEAELAKGNTACVLAEPALSNVGLVVAQDGFFQGLREACDRHGALLIMDETHTHMFAFGGLVRHWGLKPHIVVVGKNVAGGVPIGAYGFGEDLADLMDANLFDHAGDEPGLASGGTLYGSHLSLAAARATLEHVLTEEAYAHIGRLGARLAGGIQDIIDRAGLPWRAQHLESRAGWLYSTEVPISGVDAVRLMNVELSDSRRIYMANRGIWEAIVTAGPAVSFPMVDADIDLYLEVAEGWVQELL
jgi:glutamate-1-semialdehyde aminotransferase